MGAQAFDRRAFAAACLAVVIRRWRCAITQAELIARQLTIRQAIRRNRPQSVGALHALYELSMILGTQAPG
jgi:hypothetical protein